MKSNPLIIKISENNDVIGTLNPNEFRKYLEDTGAVPHGLFLSDLVYHFNSMKERCGEPERARIDLKGGK
jgi:hypothetical protein